MDQTDELHGTPAYVIGRFTDATNQHGDRTLELWDDDVRRTRSAALIDRDEHVEDVGGGVEQWRVYEMRDVTGGHSSGHDQRCDRDLCHPDCAIRRKRRVDR